MQLDVTINMLLRGWPGDDRLANVLNDHTIVLRMYGNWEQFLVFAAD